jgi:hypothetical protein
MKVANSSRQGQHLFREEYEGPLDGISSIKEILSSTIIKLRDWILVEHKDQ